MSRISHLVLEINIIHVCFSCSSLCYIRTYGLVLNSQKENLWVCIAMLVPVSEIVSAFLEDIAIIKAVTISLNELNLDSLQWTQLSPTTDKQGQHVHCCTNLVALVLSENFCSFNCKALNIASDIVSIIEKQFWISLYHVFCFSP